MKKSIFNLLASPVSIIVFIISSLTGYYILDVNSITFFVCQVFVVISAMGSFFYVCTKIPKL